MKAEEEQAKPHAIDFPRLAATSQNAWFACKRWMSGIQQRFEFTSSFSDLKMPSASSGRDLMATKRARPKRRSWSKEDVQELRAHSRSKSPVKKIARAM